MRPRYDPDSVESQIEEMTQLTEDDIDLLRHVFEDDSKPPQGLHQQGFQDHDDSTPSE